MPEKKTLEKYFSDRSKLLFYFLLIIFMAPLLMPSMEIKKPFESFKPFDLFFRFGFGFSNNSVSNIADEMRSIPEYGYPIRIGVLPKETNGSAMSGRIGMGLALSNSLNIVLDMEYSESFFYGRDTWSEGKFPGADDYIGYRYHGFTLLPVLQYYLPFKKHSLLGIHLVLGSVINLNSTIQSGQDAWNDYHPLFQKKLPGTSILTGVGVIFSSFAELEMEFRKSVNGEIPFKQICWRFLFYF